MKGSLVSEPWRKQHLTPQSRVRWGRDLMLLSLWAYLGGYKLQKRPCGARNSTRDQGLYICTCVPLNCMCKWMHTY